MKGILRILCDTLNKDKENEICDANPVSLLIYLFNETLAPTLQNWFTLEPLLSIYILVIAVLTTFFIYQNFKMKRRLNSVTRHIAKCLTFLDVARHNNCQLVTKGLDIQTTDEALILDVVTQLSKVSDVKVKLQQLEEMVEKENVRRQDVPQETVK